MRVEWDGDIADVFAPKALSLGCNSGESNSVVCLVEMSVIGLLDSGNTIIWRRMRLLTLLLRLWNYINRLNQRQGDFIYVTQPLSLSSVIFMNENETEDENNWRFVHIFGFSLLGPKLYVHSL